jgi:hypothetical protein
MIPIQPWILKAGAGVLIVCVIFFAGWSAKSALVEKKVSSLEDRIKTIKADNDLCRTGLGDLQAAIDKQNAALDKLSSESLARLERTRLESLAALKAEQEYTQRLRAKFEAEKTALLERMENMTACEACNESWLEVVR